MDGPRLLLKGQKYCKALKACSERKKKKEESKEGLLPCKKMPESTLERSDKKESIQHEESGTYHPEEGMLE